MRATVQGRCDARFEGVRRVFEKGGTTGDPRGFRLIGALYRALSG